jgi:Caspase domain
MNSRSHHSLLRGLDWIITALAAVVLTFGAAAAHASRIALVIGNDNYQHVTPLRNARADAKAVATSLESVGFTVTLKQDVSLSELKAALRTFKAQISGGDEVVFYFSGHGVQFDGTNYLVPVDLDPENEDQVADDSVPLQRVLDNLQDQKPSFALAIIDACRDNPFKGTGRSIGGRGLAPVTAANGQMVFYSAGAGQEALDRLDKRDSDPNGVFTRVLIKEIKTPGLPAEQMLKKVRDQVVDLAKQVDHVQVPALYDQSTGEFYFVPTSARAVAPAPPAAPSDPAAKPLLREVHPGTKTVVQEFWSLSPTCEVLLYPEITVVRAAGHGSVSVQKADGYATYTPDNPRYDCNRKPAGGTELLYQSKRDYRGMDSFTVEVQGQFGALATYTFDIPVGIELDSEAKPIIREVHSGTRTKIGYQVNVTPDCVEPANSELTVAIAPAHGKVIIQPGTTYPFFPKDNVRFVCNLRAVPSVDVIYQSDADFHGTDKFTVEVQTYLRHDVPGAHSFQTYQVEVR